MLFELEEGTPPTSRRGVETDNVDVEDPDEPRESRGKGLRNVFPILSLKCPDGEKGDKGHDWSGAESEKTDEARLVRLDALLR